MLYLVIIFFVVTVFFGLRFISFKKEVRKMSQQLQAFNRRQTNKKIDMRLFDRDLELLGTEINHLIDLYGAENRQRLSFEQNHKQAVANISHDLRTPLTSIIGYLQMAEKEAVSEREQKELLSIAFQRAKRLESLIEDFFELSVIESPDYLLTSERMNLRNVLIDVLMNFYYQFQEKHVDPVLQIPEHDIFINGDESALIRIVENLLSNALTHSAGNISICLEEHGQTVRLMIKNDASSLNEADVQQMFDRFYMADQSRSGKSTGLGLAIVKNLMEKMNGKITAELQTGELAIICEWKQELSIE